MRRVAGWLATVDTLPRYWNVLAMLTNMTTEKLLLGATGDRKRDSVVD